MKSKILNISRVVCCFVSFLACLHKIQEELMLSLAFLSAFTLDVFCIFERPISLNHGPNVVIVGTLLDTGSKFLQRNILTLINNLEVKVMVLEIQALIEVF